MEPQSQTAIISFVRRLWLTMRNTFSQTHLQDSSASLCQALCDARCATEDDNELLTAWLGFSFDLLRSSDMSQYNFIRTFRTSFEQSPQVAENLWPVLAEQYKDGSQASAEDLVAFIHASYGCVCSSSQCVARSDYCLGVGHCLLRRSNCGAVMSPRPLHQLRTLKALCEAFLRMSIRCKWSCHLSSVISTNF